MAKPQAKDVSDVKDVEFVEVVQNVNNPSPSATLCHASGIVNFVNGVATVKSDVAEVLREEGYVK